MVPELKLSGLAKMLAQHCEVKHVASNEIEFCVPETQKHLLDKDYQARVQAALRAHLGQASAGKVLCWDGHGHDPGGTGESGETGEAIPGHHGRGIGSVRARAGGAI